MAQEPFSPWVPTIIGVAIQGAAAVFTWFKFFRDRSDKHVETVTELRDRVRSTMDVQSLAMYDRLEAENKRLTARLRDIERDRDRGWDLARYWNSETHRIKHLFAGLLHLANLRLEQAGGQPVTIPEIVFPSIEDPALPRDNSSDV
jgi:hypothetical protein